MKKTIYLLLCVIILSKVNAQESTKMTLNQKKNPFIEGYNTPNGTPPFELISNNDYIPAYKAGIEQQNNDIKRIINNKNKPTFENTIIAIDESGQILNRVSATFSAIRGANSNEEIQAISEEVFPLISEHNDNIFLNEKLFNKIKTIYEETVSISYTTEQKRLTDKYYKNFVRSGILLNKKDKNRLREINKELSSLSLKFGKNLLAETNNYELIIEDPKDLAGLTEDIIKTASKIAENRGYKGKWVFTLSKTSWLPFLQYAENRDLREQLYKAMYNRCNNNNQYDNKEIVNKIVNLRLEKANILGFNSFADYTLAETMAKNPENVYHFLNQIWEYALPQAKLEAETLQAMIYAEGNDFKLKSWDWFYYTEKIRKEKYSLNEETLKPYFEINNVRDGAFLVANKLYGITFQPTSEVSIYNKDIQVFKVYDKDEAELGILYLDYLPRSGKRNGAWMGSFQKQHKTNGKNIKPIIYNVGNFSLPTEDKPSLLTLDEVTTLFHEFGHGLHGLLSDVNYNGLSGTAVPRDFVELPSQVYEHWALSPEVLKLYAKNYITGKIIPDSLIQKIQNAENFNMGFRTTELVAASFLDMDWHTITKHENFNVDTFESSQMDKIGLIPEIIPRYKSTYFAHIFDGGYSAGYYSYLWSEVLDADAFEAFVESGIFNTNTGESFRKNILSKGGTEDPMILYRNFRGSDPNPIYLLKNRGFVK